MRLTPLFASLLSSTLLAAAALAIPAASAQPNHEEAKRPADACWKIDGPHGSGTEVYFNAANNCAEPRHCRVWVNWREPPVQVHLEPGTKGRIDVGVIEPSDKFSYDCVPVAAGM